MQELRCAECSRHRRAHVHLGKNIRIVVRLKQWSPIIYEPSITRWVRESERERDMYRIGIRDHRTAQTQCLKGPCMHLMESGSFRAPLGKYLVRNFGLVSVLESMNEGKYRCAEVCSLSIVDSLGKWRGRKWPWIWNNQNGRCRWRDWRVKMTRLLWTMSTKWTTSTALPAQNVQNILTL